MILTLREFQKYPKELGTLLVQSSSMDGKSSHQPFPVGMNWKFGRNLGKGLSALQIGPHSKTVLCAIKDTTDSVRRRSGVTRRKILTNLQAHGINNEFIPSNRYFTSLPHYKFVISPEGNGIDCQRTYEALLAGCIPIVERNPLIEEKYRGCPVLYTTDYSEITVEYLESEYAKMIDQTYDFSRLFLSFYDEATQACIKECGNFWMKKVSGKDWYPSS